MSKWNRPMTVYRSTEFRCGVCGDALRQVRDQGWVHQIAVGIKDPSWHLPKPEAIA